MLFDLDGTLTDPGVGITKSVQYALERFGIKVADRKELYPFIGPPLLNSFMDFYGMDEQAARQAVGFYREYYKDQGIFENEVYPGIPDLLTVLQEQRRSLAVATSKPTIFAQRILEHFDLAKYFSVVVGSNLDGTRVEKEEVIAHTLSLNSSAESTLMVGDRKYDILAARKLGIEVLGVGYGYGSMEELKAAEPNFLAASVDEMRSLLVG